MGQDSPTKVPEVLQSETGGVGGGIIHMYEPPPLDSASGSAVLIYKVKPCDDLAEDNLGNGNWSVNKFLVNEPL